MDRKKMQEETGVHDEVTWTPEQIEKLALRTYGKRLQMVVAVEEMSELQKVLCKYLRGEDGPKEINHAAEEIADVQIMLEQMLLALDCAEEVAVWREKKLKRLLKRMFKE